MDSERESSYRGEGKKKSGARTKMKKKKRRKKKKMKKLEKNEKNRKGGSRKRRGTKKERASERKRRKKLEGCRGKGVRPARNFGLAAIAARGRGRADAGKEKYSLMARKSSARRAGNAGRVAREKKKLSTRGWVTRGGRRLRGQEEGGKCARAGEEGALSLRRNAHLSLPEVIPLPLQPFPLSPSSRFSLLLCALPSRLPRSRIS